MSEAGERLGVGEATHRELQLGEIVAVARKMGRWPVATAGNRAPLRCVQIVHSDTASWKARTILSSLLGITTVPDLAVFVDRRYQQGARIDPGRYLDAAGLAATVIGDPIAPDGSGGSGSIHFEIDVPVTCDGVWLMVIDFHDEQFGESSGSRHAVFSPYRTCVGVAVAAGLALAAAQLAHGEYLDEEIRMLRPGVHEPSQVINRTRLPEGNGDFATQCEKYLRQFPDLNGWPRDRSMR